MKRGALAVAALAAAAAAPSLANGFVYDDVLVIQQNPLVHGLGGFAAIWGSSYWPSGLLYRPLTLQLFALEWTAGGGNPFLFHAVSVLLAVTAALLFLRLASRLLSPPQHQAGAPYHADLGLWIAAFASGLFAVHPVHVEAVANLVGQSELLATVFALLAVERYLAWRAEGGLTLPRRMLLAGVTLAAILSKETGYVVPLLLAAAELCVVRVRRDRVAATFFLQGGVVVAALLLRAAVLGSLAGETTAVVFRGLDPGERAIAMLAVVPEWVRLLLWPLHLQAEYGPPALPVTASLTLTHALGGLLLALGALACAWSWRRRPVIAFGLLWTLLALVPVSNLPAPTGIVLAERVLFLPSAGVTLAAAGLLARLLARVGRPLRIAAATAGGALLVAAAARTLARQPVWRTQEGFFRALTRDAPRTYRAHFVASRYLYGEGRFPEAERAARQALALYPQDARVHEQLGQALRVQGRCGEALPVLTEGLRLAPDGTTLRSRLIECALAVGDTSRAREAAREAVALGQGEFLGTLRRLAP